MLIASPMGFFYKDFQSMPPEKIAIIVGIILLIAFSVAFLLLVLLYHRFLFFSQKNYKRLLLNYLLKHNLFEKKNY
ncbi:MAG: hypothetical protein MUW51_00750 [Lactococcus lactis]|nr:hypothetical protein [Lactococcus lactis]